MSKNDVTIRYVEPDLANLGPMDMEKFEEYCTQVFDTLGVVGIDIANSSSITLSDMGLDSFHALEIVLVTEEMAGLQYSPGEMPAIYTLADAFNYFVKCEHESRTDKAKKE